jgi:16S rRNA processing protein RimM
MSSSRNRASSNRGNNEPWDLLIGEITAPQGLHGEVRVYPHTDFPERFAELTEVGLRRDSDVQVIPVVKSRVNGRRIVLQLQGVDTIDQAEALRGVHLVVPKSQAVPLGDDEYYHHQLLGLEVVTTEGESLGRITHIWPTGANDVYETPIALIPAVKEYVREIDLAQGRMLVQARRGLKKNETEE